MVSVLRSVVGSPIWNECVLAHLSPGIVSHSSAQHVTLRLLVQHTVGFSCVHTGISAEFIAKSVRKKHWLCGQLTSASIDSHASNALDYIS